MEKARKKILIITGRYLPGYKDGGPVRSIKNLTDYLGNEYEFQILTCDRDHGDYAPYPTIVQKTWNTLGNTKVFYVPPKGFTCCIIKKLAKEVDIVYLCGCFSDYSITTLILNWLGLIQRPLVIAAMGLFSPLEFKIKFMKKKLFVTVFNMMGIFKNVYWSATSEREISEIRLQIKTREDRFFIAEDLPRKTDISYIIKEKTPGYLNVVWISRIARKKNLLGAIEILKNVKSNINFTIYGSIYDAEYWEKCTERLNALPTNINWVYQGNIESDKVITALQNEHIFLFPTLGENYGHVIQEALSAGCPCIISDQTPWMDLENYNAGFVFSLKELQEFSQKVDYFANLDNNSMNQHVQQTINYAIRYKNEKVQKTGYRKIFDSL